jgi:phenylacetate-CoA ligase
LGFAVKGIQLTAENAHAEQIAAIKTAFATKVFFQYGHSEASVFGYTSDESCEYSCSPLYGLVEVLREDGLAARKGEVGEIVVTGFYNFALPFVRYRTGDLAVFGGDADGIVRLKRIVGRTQDYVLTRGGERVALTALVFGQHYHAFQHIRKWQIQQDTVDQIAIRIVKAKGYSSADEDEIRSKFQSLCGVETKFEYVDEIALTARGKFRFMIQNAGLASAQRVATQTGAV